MFTTLPFPFDYHNKPVRYPDLFWSFFSNKWESWGQTFVKVKQSLKWQMLSPKCHKRHTFYCWVFFPNLSSEVFRRPESQIHLKARDILAFPSFQFPLWHGGKSLAGITTQTHLNEILDDILLSELKFCQGQLGWEVCASEWAWIPKKPGVGGYTWWPHEKSL